jgi:voltage-gated sodium channel
MFTLFQLLTLEGWADIARNMMTKFPSAWLYFISFIIISSFIVMNVIVGVVVNAISDISNEAKKDKQINSENCNLEEELFKLKEQISRVEQIMKKS